MANTNTNMNYTDLGERVRLLRRQKKLTQEELAERLGISASFLGHIERGTRVASLETLVTMCNTLQVTPEYFLSASLHHLDCKTPDGITPETRAQLTEFLRLAQETLRHWDD